VLQIGFTEYTEQRIY